MNEVVLDVETTTFNKGHPFDPRNELISYSTYIPDNASFKYYTDPDFYPGLRGSVVSDCLIGFNIKFDLHWCSRSGIDIPLTTKVWDCQLAEFILSGQEDSYISLNECLERYGLPTKKDVVAEYWEAGIDTKDIPVGILEEYNNWDVYVTYLLYKTQLQLLSPEQQRLVWLEGEDLKTLQAAEFAGIKWDADAAERELANLSTTVQNLNERICEYLPDGVPDGCFNIDSGDHLSALLYGGTISFKFSERIETVYKSGPQKGQERVFNRWYETQVAFPQRFKPLEGTEVKKSKDNPEAVTKFYQTDAPTLKQLKTRRKEDLTLLSYLHERSEVNKVFTMIKSIKNKIAERNWEDNMIHGQFNQNVVITGRLSSSAPNLQNSPPEIDKFFVSRYA